MNNKTDRITGDYWVKTKKGYPWQLAHYSLKQWYLFGIEDSYDDIDFEEIDERLIVREEPEVILQESHECQYCHAITRQPDSVCWKNPKNSQHK